MWKNEATPAFVQYLRGHNDSIDKRDRGYSSKVLFFGLDLYSLYRSADEVLAYLESVDFEGAKTMHRRSEFYTYDIRPRLTSLEGIIVSSVLVRTRLVTRLRHNSALQRYRNPSASYLVT
jgi:hypothetical protein